MTDATGPGALLAVEPGADEDAIRRAYVRALKRIDLDNDPQAFQALRDARDALLSDAAAAAAAPPATEAAEAEAVLAAVQRKRRAGDVAGAVALLQRFLEEQPAGSPLVAAVGLLLFERIALERALSPVLFRFLADRFDWRDASGAAARSDPDRHAIVAERIAAEDWFEAVQRAASLPDDRIARTLLADPPGSETPELDRDGRAAALRVMARLREWDRFLLARFDARNLVALRDAAQGPAYVPPAKPTRPAASVPAAPPPPPSPPPTVRQGWWHRSPVRRVSGRLSWRQRLVLLLIGSAVALAYSPFDGIRPVTTPNGTGVAIDPALLARSYLDANALAWARVWSDGRRDRMDFTTLLTGAAALQSIHYGIDEAPPNRLLPMPQDPPAWPPTPAQQESGRFLDLPPGTRFVSVSVTYRNGASSPVIIFPLRKNLLP